MKITALHAKMLEQTDVWMDSAIAEAFDLMSLGGGEPRRSQHTGIKALMVAMLQDAIECYLRPSGRTRVEAEYWITSPSRRPTFSFCVVCETLGLDPDAVRRAIRRLPRREGKGSRVLPRIRPNGRRTACPADLPDYHEPPNAVQASAQ